MKQIIASLIFIALGLLAAIMPAPSGSLLGFLLIIFSIVLSLFGLLGLLAGVGKLVR